MKLTINKLKEEAAYFCKHESNITHNNLIGVTDGKAVGTYIEHKFEEHLKNKYEITIGSSSKGIDLPDLHINTDIKVTSIKKPQSSSPFKNIEQKIYGLGYNLLIFVYEKTDINNCCYLDFKQCIFLEAEKTGDYNLTRTLREMVENGADKTKIIKILKEGNVPGNEQILETIAKKIMLKPPKQGYLTISNVFQWRLRYNNVINIDKEVEGIYNYDEYNNELKNQQTPLYLTDIICKFLKKDLKIDPTVIIEPKCEINNFLNSSLKFFPKKQLYTLDVEKNMLNKKDTGNSDISLINEKYTIKFNNFNKNDSFLIIGNLQQINTSKLSEIKINKNNYSILKQIILKNIDIFKSTTSTIAFLCKNTISRDIFIDLVKNNIPYSFVKQINFNLSKNLRINKDTCLFIIQFGGKKETNKSCEVSDISNPSKVLYKFGFVHSKFYSNIDIFQQIDGTCQIEWKSGVKHDCAKIMELRCENNKLMNNLNEYVSLENKLLYPLLKPSDFKKPIVTETSKYVIITQQKIKQDTNYIKTEAPKTWKYLNNNKIHFDNRKSKTYEKTPDFSIFGIGNYAFKKYKVVISGFCKDPRFTLVYHEKPIMLDDSCYYLPFDDYDDAYITMLILNSEIVKKFLKNIAFLESKRPFSKSVLKRIDIEKCLKILNIENLKKIEKELGLDNNITNKKFHEYKMKYENLI